MTEAFALNWRELKWIYGSWSFPWYSLIKIVIYSHMGRSRASQFTQTITNQCEFQEPAELKAKANVCKKKLNLIWLIHEWDLMNWLASVVVCLKNHATFIANLNTRGICLTLNCTIFYKLFSILVWNLKSHKIYLFYSEIPSRIFFVLFQWKLLILAVNNCIRFYFHTTMQMQQNSHIICCFFRWF